MSISINRIFVLIFALINFYNPIVAQVSILNANINAYNITPQAMCQVNVMNSDQDMQVVMETKLTNSGNEALLVVKTQPFLLKKGMNTLSGYNLALASTEFGNSPQAIRVKTSHTLPSGKFNYCCIIRSLTTELSDDYCEDIESDLNEFLLLVSPGDGDTIDTRTPLLLWTHSDPFNLLAPGEFFKLTLVELNKDQSPEAGVTTNVPLFVKNYLTSHQVPYPSDAHTLEKGKWYGWQVQKIANGGIIIAQTEAWQFIVRPDKVIKENKYAALKKTLDAGYYTAQNNKVFFKFDEEYAGGNVSGVIYDSKRQLIQPKVHNDTGVENKNSTINLKQSGYNKYEINLDELNISTGFYTIEVKNAKGELFLLKFFVQ